MLNFCRLARYPAGRSGSYYSSEGDDLLRAADLRITRPRQAIARVLIGARDHPDAEQVLARARARQAGISPATAYRIPAVLADKGLLRTHIFDGSAARFELADCPHHDHPIDFESGEIREFVSHEIELKQSRVAAEHGYEIIAHRLELYCREAGEARRCRRVGFGAVFEKSVQIMCYTRAHGY